MVLVLLMLPYDVGCVAGALGVGCHGAGTMKREQVQE